MVSIASSALVCHAITAMLLVIPSLAFVSPRVFSASSPATLMRGVSMDVSEDIGTITIRPAERDEISRAAVFLSQSMYPAEMPRGQRNELARLEQADLMDRYGGRMREIFPNVLLLAIQDEEIIGCVGLDCQLFDPARERFGKVKYTKSGAQEEGKEVKVVLGNLAVRRDKRGQGLAKSLVKMCNDYAKSWGYDEIYLLVESENEPAKKLYTKEGYKLLFADEDATCVAPGMYNLQTASCINLCYVKSMTEPKKGLDLGAVFGAIGSLFGRNNDN